MLLWSLEELRMDMLADRQGGRSAGRQAGRLGRGTGKHGRMHMPDPRHTMGMGSIAFWPERA